VFTIDWSQEAAHLTAAATTDAGWNAMVAAAVVRPADRVAADIGCGGGGMAKALAEALPAGATVVAVDSDPDVLDEARRHTAGLVRCELASLDDGPDALRTAIGGPADLVWAAHSVHHAADQQAAVDALAALLAPGGRLVLAEGGLPSRHLPWDLGLGEPGLEVRFDAANDRWFGGMRAELPGSVPMPYGWPVALRRAGLVEVTTRTLLVERPAPLSGDDRARVVDRLGRWVDRLRPTGFIGAADLATWDRLLDPDDPHWLGNRDDLTDLSARSIHVGHAKA
jgi:SAM-dependent methyltransferase